jgi:hypothetical protein
MFSWLTFLLRHARAWILCRNDMPDDMWPRIRMLATRRYSRGSRPHKLYPDGALWLARRGAPARPPSRQVRPPIAASLGGVTPLPARRDPWRGFLRRSNQISAQCVCSGQATSVPPLPSGAHPHPRSAAPDLTYALQQFARA